MRKILLLAVCAIVSLSAYSQSATDLTLDMGPKVSGPLYEQSSKSNWNLQFEHNLNRLATAGIVADTAHFWVTVWNANKVYKYTHAGALVDSISLSGSGFPTSGNSYLRDITWDGTYFYGGITDAKIFKMDFNNDTVVDVINCPSGTVVRWITYDPTADGGQGGFWVGNWSDGAKLISRTGTVLNTIPAANLPGISAYGAAYDTSTTNGGPFLWLFSQTTNGSDMVQVDVASKQPKGIVDVTQDFAVTSGIAGGAYIQNDIVSNTTTIGGLVQGQKIFGYNLMSAISPNHDLTIVNLDIPKQVQLNSPMQVKGVLQNRGSNTITSTNVSWQVNGGTVYTQNLTGIGIQCLRTYNFTHSDTWTPTSSGIYTIKCWTDSPNGVPDDNPDNDTITFEVTVLNRIVQRLPLHEGFTSSTCGPCRAGNINLKGVFNANPNKWVCVKYQMHFPGTGDPYYTAEGRSRFNYYGISSVPALVVDGGTSINSGSYTSAMLNTAYNVPSFVELLADYSQPGDGKTVDINVTINPVMNIPVSGLRLHVAIFEYKTFNNVKSNGETEFDFVMKKMLPNAGGTMIGALTEDVPSNHTFSYTFNGNYILPPNASSPVNHLIQHSVEKFWDLGVVVWLQNTGTKEVLQAAYATKTAGIGEVNDGSGIIALFPNPTNDNAYIKYQITNTSEVSIAVYDLSGRMVLSHNFGNQEQGIYDVNIPVEELSSGLYLVKLQIGNHHFTDKLNIRK